MVLVVILAAVWGSGPVIVVLPWFNPLLFTFIALTSISVAFLALGRYQVLHDPFSYWVGIGFAMNSITMAFYVLAWPGLLPDGGAFIAQLPGTAGFMATLNPTIFLSFILTGVWAARSNSRPPARRHWLLSLAAWSLVFTLLYGAIVVFEGFLPEMVRPDGSFTPALVAWNAVNLLLMIAGTFLTLRRYRLSGDPFTAYLVFPQLALIFTTVALVIGGKRYDLWWYLARFAMSGGFLVALFGLLADYVSLFRRERESQAQLERRNRDLQNFTFVAAHDLQEPLRKIEILGDALLENAAGLDERQQDYILRMRKSAQQMRALVSGLFQFTRLSAQAQPFQPVDLQQAAGEVLAGFEADIRQAEAEVAVNGLPVIAADPGQMRLLLQHLVENGLKFRVPGRKPRVNVYSRQPTPGEVQIIVEDNGMGFDPAHAGQLFEPFERLVGKNQAEYNGIGMGLALCRWIAERHGGEILAQGAPGKGSCFIVTLPVRQPERLNQPPTEASNDD